jgi:hypothetical protein
MPTRLDLGVLEMCIGKRNLTVTYSEKCVLLKFLRGLSVIFMDRCQIGPLVERLWYQNHGINYTTFKPRRK